MVFFIDLCRFEFFTTSVGVFDGVPTHQVFKLDRRFGSSPCLFHNTKRQNFVGFSIEFDRQSVLDIGRIDGDVQCGRRRRRRSALLMLMISCDGGGESRSGRQQQQGMKDKTKHGSSRGNVLNRDVWAYIFTDWVYGPSSPFTVY